MRSGGFASDYFVAGCTTTESERMGIAELRKLSLNDAKLEFIESHHAALNLVQIFCLNKPLVVIEIVFCYKTRIISLYNI